MADDQIYQPGGRDDHIRLHQEWFDDDDNARWDNAELILDQLSLHIWLKIILI